MWAIGVMSGVLVVNLARSRKNCIKNADHLAQTLN